MEFIKNEMKKKAIIISIKGYQLSKKEEILLANEKPWGLILFKRNIYSLNQIKKLIKKIKKLTNDSKFPIMIDEEGATVSRLSKIINNNLSQKFFGDIYKINTTFGKEVRQQNFKLLEIVFFIDFTYQFSIYVNVTNHNYTNTNNNNNNNNMNNNNSNNNNHNNDTNNNNNNNNNNHNHNDNNKTNKHNNHNNHISNTNNRYINTNII